MLLTPVRIAAVPQEPPEHPPAWPAASLFLTAQGHEVEQRRTTFIPADPVRAYPVASRLDRHLQTALEDVHVPRVQFATIDEHLRITSGGVGRESSPAGFQVRKHEAPSWPALDPPRQRVPLRQTLPTRSVR